MHMRGTALITLGWLLVCTLLVVGCNGSDLAQGVDLAFGDATTDTGGKHDLHGDVAAPDAAQGTVTVQGTFGLYHQQTGLAGAAICKYIDGKKTNACTQSDVDGNYTIEIPANVDTGITMEKSGYWSGFVPIHTAPSTIKLNFGTSTDSEAATEFGTLGATYPDPGKGAIMVNAVEGAVFSVTPSAGLGPFYGDEKGYLVKSTTAMTTSRYGAVLGLPPGVYEVDVTHPTKTCTNAGNWPSAGNHTLRVPVLGGSWSGTVLSCQ